MNNWRQILKESYLQKRSVQYLTKGEILKLYNKYRTGHDYTKEAWDMKYKVLDICNSIFEAYVRMLKLERESEKQRADLEKKYIGQENNPEYREKQRKLLDKIDADWNKFTNEVRTTGRADSLRRLKYHAKSLENATDPFDILLALDKVFNVMHDQGPMFGIMLQRAMSMSEEDIQELLSVFDQVRDLGTK
ncbi:MAG: hypothetical protein WC346_10070 [Methanogenium sp.]|jgi:hypothetical protein